MTHRRRRLKVAFRQRRQRKELQGQGRHTKEVNRALGVVRLVGIVEFVARGTVKLDLPCQGAGPDNDRENRHERQTKEATSAPSEASAIEDEEPNYQSSDDGAGTLQCCVQCS